MHLISPATSLVIHLHRLPFVTKLSRFYLAGNVLMSRETESCIKLPSRFTLSPQDFGCSFQVRIENVVPSFPGVTFSILIFFTFGTVSLFLIPVFVLRRVSRKLAIIGTFRKRALSGGSEKDGPPCVFGPSNSAVVLLPRFLLSTSSNSLLF